MEWRQCGDPSRWEALCHPRPHKRLHVCLESCLAYLPRRRRHFHPSWPPPSPLGGEFDPYTHPQGEEGSYSLLSFKGRTAGQWDSRTGFERKEPEVGLTCVSPLFLSFSVLREACTIPIQFMQCWESKLPAHQVGTGPS